MVQDCSGDYGSEGMVSGLFIGVLEKHRGEIRGERVKFVDR